MRQEFDGVVMVQAKRSETNLQEHFKKYIITNIKSFCLSKCSEQWPYSDSDLCKQVVLKLTVGRISGKNVKQQ